MDWVNGGSVYHLDGRREDSRVHWAYRFDGACATQDGSYAVIYQRLGTKALLIREGKLLREFNRSFYHAHVYEYPIWLWSAADGRTLLAHCPQDYCRLDIEDVETGVCLTQADRKPGDFFHSQLMVNSTGTRLLSAGWFWHPWSSVLFYDLAGSLRDPRILDRIDNSGTGKRSWAEEGTACWQTPDRVLLGATSEGSLDRNGGDETDAEPALRANGIALYDLATRLCLKSLVLDEPPGTMMPIGESHVVCFYHYPRLVSLESEKVVAQWEELDTGKRQCSILIDEINRPLALDPMKRRFAVAGERGITVIQLRIT